MNGEESKVMNSQEDELPSNSYRVTSQKTTDYNSIAWSANEDGRYWWPDSFAGYYWPLNEKHETLDCFTKLYVDCLGYEISGSQEHEPGFEKIAIYTGSDGKPKHVARQLSSGKWTSKLGDNEDIEHDTLNVLEGSNKYGFVARILRRANRVNTP